MFKTIFMLKARDLLIALNSREHAKHFHSSFERYVSRYSSVNETNRRVI